MLKVMTYTVRSINDVAAEDHNDLAAVGKKHSKSMVLPALKLYILKWLKRLKIHTINLVLFTGNPHHIIDGPHGMLNCNISVI